jgi:Leucine-rich repeat (LRR) protein
MKRLLVCLLLVGVVGCGKSEQVAQQLSEDHAQDEQQQCVEQPSGESEQDPIKALQELGVLPLKPSKNELNELHRDADGNVWALDLYGSHVTDAVLVHLERLPSLSAINLNGCNKITDGGLEHLKGLTKLQELYLTHTQITDAGLADLQELTKLETLWLDNTQVTDVGLVHLKRFTKLESLSLDNTQITDAGLIHLKGLTSLLGLGLRDTQVTDAAVAELQKALPNCEITH